MTRISQLPHEPDPATNDVIEIEQGSGGNAGQGAYATLAELFVVGGVTRLAPDTWTNGQSPSRYTSGLTIFTATAAAGYPQTGVLVSFMSGDIVAQFHVPRNNASSIGPVWRAGLVGADTWEPWRKLYDGSNA